MATIASKVAEITGKANPTDFPNPFPDRYHPNLKYFRLFLLDLLFISNHAKNGDHIIYASVTDPNGKILNPETKYIRKLAEMFPDCTFDVWTMDDEFYPKSENIKKYAKTLDEGTNEFADIPNKLLIINNIFTDTETISDQIVSDQMIKQSDLCKIVNAKSSFLIFVLPKSGGTFDYYDGEKYLQPYSRSIFPEKNASRLVTSDYDKMTSYDILDYNKKMEYHNEIYKSRPVLDRKWDTFIKRYRIHHRWNNILTLYICKRYLNIKDKIDNNSTVNDEESLELFGELSKIFNVKKSLYNIRGRLTASNPTGKMTKQKNRK